MLKHNLSVLFAISLLLTACGQPAPAPDVTSIPPVLATAAATVTAAVTVEPSILTATPTETPQISSTLPLPDDPAASLPIIIAGASPAFLSSLGQLAFIQYGVLVVETAPGNGVFTEISRYVNFARWSPDGSKLLFDVNPIPLSDPAVDDAQLADYRIWFSQASQIMAITDIIPGFPQAPYTAASWIPQAPAAPAAFQNAWIPAKKPGGQTTWSTDSNQILFVNLTNSVNLPVSFPGSNTVIIADLNKQNFWLASEAVYISRVMPTRDSTFILQDHCGALCEWLTGYDLQGNELWELPWVTDGSFAVASNASFLVNAGRISYAEPTDTNTVDIIETVTGEFRPIWHLAPDEFSSRLISIKP